MADLQEAVHIQAFEAIQLLENRVLHHQTKSHQQGLGPVPNCASGEVGVAPVT